MMRNKFSEPMSKIKTMTKRIIEIRIHQAMIGLEFYEDVDNLLSADDS